MFIQIYLFALDAANCTVLNKHVIQYWPVKSSQVKKSKKKDLRSNQSVSQSVTNKLSHCCCYRYASTLVTSTVENTEAVAREVFFNVILPETAFISR